MTDLLELRRNPGRARTARFSQPSGRPARWLVWVALGVTGAAHAGAYSDLSGPNATATNSAAGAIELQTPATVLAQAPTQAPAQASTQLAPLVSPQAVPPATVQAGAVSGPAHFTHLPMAAANGSAGLAHLPGPTTAVAAAGGSGSVSGSSTSAAPPAVPTHSSMPARGTIPAGPSMGSVLPPGMRQSPRLGAVAAMATATAKPADGFAATPLNTSVAAAPPTAPAKPSLNPVTLAALAPSNTAVPVATAAAPSGPALSAPAATTTPVAPAASSVTIVTARDPIPGANPLGDAIKASAERFLMEQTVGLPGQITVAISPVSARNLAPCPALEAFLPPGARLWGHTTVGVRCVMEKPWTLYVQARISVRATYFVATRSIAPGETIQAGDLVPQQGDLTFLPRAVITDTAQAVGSVALARITPGLPLRQDMLRAALSVQQGQTVHLVASGPGFSITADGSAMQNAATGEQVKVKTGSGQIVIGIVRSADTVEIPM